MRFPKTASLILFLLVLAKFIVQYLVVHPAYDLHRDEYLHLDQANHLAWGYASVPPVTSLVSLIIQKLGNTEFWVKFFPALFGALTIVVVWKTAARLGGKLFATSAAGVAVLLSSLLRINMLYQPNSLEILCWTSLFYFLIRYIREEQARWLYWAGFIFAIGFLNKYNIVFPAAGLLPALLLTPQRKIFRNKHFYGAAALALILVLPNLFWQWENNFPVFRHLEELSRTQLQLVKRSDFLLDQLFFFVGSAFVLLAAWIALVIYSPFRPFRFLLLSLLFTLGIFLFLKAKSYYAIGLYPIFLAFGAVYIERIFDQGWKKWIRALAYLFPLLLFIPMLELAFPLVPAGQLAEKAIRDKQGWHRWEDGKTYPLSQDFADMLGWKELARKTEGLFQTIPSSANTLLLCDNYGEAGAINYYSRNKNMRAHSFSADYMTWLKEELEKNKKEYSDVILVQEAKNNNIEMLRPHFENIIVADSITTEWAREQGTRIIWLQNARVNIRDYLKKRIAEHSDGSESN